MTRKMEKREIGNDLQTKSVQTLHKKNNGATWVMDVGNAANFSNLIMEELFVETTLVQALGASTRGYTCCTILRSDPGVQLQQSRPYRTSHTQSTFNKLIVRLQTLVDEIHLENSVERSNYSCIDPREAKFFNQFQLNSVGLNSLIFNISKHSEPNVNSL